MLESLIGRIVVLRGAELRITLMGSMMMVRWSLVEMGLVTTGFLYKSEESVKTLSIKDVMTSGGLRDDLLEP